MGKKGGNKSTSEQTAKKNSKEESVKREENVKEPKRWVFSRLFNRKKAEKDVEQPVLIKEPDFLRDIDKGIHSTEIEDELRLWLADGRVVKNIKGLAAALKTMKPSAYKQHVGKRKNNFRDWVRDIMEQEALAKAVGKAKTRRETVKVLEKFLKPSSGKLIPQAQKLIDEKELPAPKNLEEKILPEKTEKVDELERGEMRLLEEDAELNREEEALNARRLELSNKRYELVKKRGDLERQKFQKFLEKYKHKEDLADVSVGSYPDSKIIVYTKEELISMIDKAQNFLRQGAIDEAKEIFNAIKASFDRAIFSSEEKKKIGYDIMGLEAEIKLKALG